MLGSVIEKATGKTLDKAIDELVVAPLSLADAGFSTEPSERLTAAYFDGSPEPKRMEGSVAVPIGEGKLTFSPDRILDAKRWGRHGRDGQGCADLPRSHPQGRQPDPVSRDGENDDAGPDRA
ncbi:hypothetical protein ACQKGL_28055 [Ensifer adhaerens]|uniref:hypothetical protein n=1 Tax=Ensifer adhaerens TaxID=106592 RepID=UPI003CFE1938